jgi:hypothetical protein
MAIETTRTIRLDQLVSELDDVGISVPNGLGSHVSGDTTTIHTYDGDGHIVALTDAAQPIVDRHTAVAPTDPRTAVIDGMDISDGDKAKLKAIIIG